jgi:hypothetical protein
MLLRILIIYTILSILSFALEMFMMWKAPRGHQDDQGYHEDFDEVD